MGFTIAIDGPAAAGKGTLSKAISAYFNLPHLDTGLLYRAVGARVLAGEDPLIAAKALTVNDLNRDDLRSPDVAQTASRVAARTDVRAALLQFQKTFSTAEGGAVLDGRDIGTVICPEAEVKLFVTASAEVRAKRRFDELADKGLNVTFETVLADVAARDARDASRTEAPMVAASDAIVIDTSELTIEAAIERAIAVISTHCDAPKPA